MRWSQIKELYESELRAGASATGVFDMGTDEGNKRWEDLRKRVVEHVSLIINFVVFCPAASTELEKVLINSKISVVKIPLKNT